MPYGNMCVQYVKNDFTLCAIIVGVFKYEGKHTAEDLYRSCEDAEGLVTQWHLGNFKLVYTTDSFSGNVKVFKECDRVPLHGPSITQNR